MIWIALVLLGAGIGIGYFIKSMICRYNTNKIKKKIVGLKEDNAILQIKNFDLYSENFQLKKQIESQKNKTQ